MTNFRKAAILAIAFCTLLMWVINSSSVQADQSSTILRNLIGNDRDALFAIANERYLHGDDLEASIYLAALMGRYRDYRDSAEINNAFEQSLNAAKDEIKKLQEDFNEAREKCGEGCNKETGQVAFVRASLIEVRDPLPPVSEEQPDDRLLCRGGGSMRFTLAAQQTDSTILVAFESGVQKGGTDYENIHLLRPGQCTLLRRKISSSEHRLLNLQPFLRQVDTYSISWDVDENIQGFGPGVVKSRVSSGTSIDPLDSLSAIIVATDDSGPVFTVWQALDDLKDPQRYVEFEVATDASDDIVAIGAVERGPWSKYEQIDIAFQNGREPTNSYTGATDSAISQANPSTRHGDDVECYLDGDDPPQSGRDLSTLMRWDIRAIPPGSTIKSASITLDVFRDSESEYQVYALKRDWNEEEVTWEAYRSGLQWAGPGAAGSADRSKTELASFNALGIGEHTFDLNTDGIAALQAWVDNQSDNHGFIILNPDETDGMDFYCSEVGSAETRPLLKISYSP